MKKIFLSIIFLLIIFLFTTSIHTKQVSAATYCSGQIHVGGFTQDKNGIPNVPKGYSGTFDMHTADQFGNAQNCFTVGGSYRIVAYPAGKGSVCQGGYFCESVNVDSKSHINASVNFGNYLDKDITGSWTIDICDKTWFNGADCSKISATGTFNLVDPSKNNNPLPFIDQAKQPLCYIAQNAPYSIVVSNLNAGQYYDWYFTDECSNTFCNFQTIGKGTRDCGWNPSGIYCGGYAIKNTIQANKKTQTVTDATTYTFDLSFDSRNNNTDQLIADRTICVDSTNGQQRKNGSNCILLHFYDPQKKPNNTSCNANIACEITHKGTCNTPGTCPAGTGPVLQKDGTTYESYGCTGSQTECCVPQTECESKYNGTCDTPTPGLSPIADGQKHGCKNVCYTAGCSPTNNTDPTQNNTCGTLQGDYYCCAANSQCFYPPNVAPTKNSGTCLSCMGKGQQCNGTNAYGKCCQGQNLLCINSSGQIDSNGTCTTCIADNDTTNKCDQTHPCCSSANDNANHCTNGGKCVANCEEGAKCPNGDTDCCSGQRCTNGLCTSNSNLPSQPTFPPVNWCPVDTKTGVATCDTALGKWVTDPSGFITNLFAVILSLAGTIALLILVYAGYVLMTSQGSPDKLQLGKELITAAIVGLLFTIFSLVILQTIGLDILHLPGFMK